MYKEDRGYIKIILFLLAVLAASLAWSNVNPIQGLETTRQTERITCPTTDCIQRTATPITTYNPQQAGENHE